MKHFSKVLSNLVVIFFLFSCSTSKHIDPSIHEALTDSENITEIRHKNLVALMVPLSGHAKHIGKSMLAAAELAIYDNEYADLTLEIIDTSSPEFDAKQVVQDLKSKNVNLILGPLFSAETIQVATFAKDADIAVLSFSNNVELSSKGVVVFGLTPYIQLKKIIDFGRKSDIEEFYLLLPDNQYGKMVEKSASYQGTVFKSYFYSDTNALSISFSNAIASIKQAPTTRKGLIFTESGANLETFSKLLGSEEKPENLTIFGFESWDEANVVKINNLNGSYFIKARTKEYKLFEEKYYAIYNSRPAYVASLAYDAVALSAQLIYHKIPPYFRNIIASGQRQGTSFTYHFNQNGITLYNLPIAKIENGSVLQLD